MWQIFNNRGKWAGSCSIEPDHADLAERGEFAVRYDNTSAVLTADPETKEVTQLPSPPDAYHVWDGKTWMLTPEAAARQFTDQKAALLGQAATAAQAFVNTAADVDSVPDFELQTWPLQSAEALAWSDDPAAATPVLDTIAAARNIDRVALIKKPSKKPVPTACSPPMSPVSAKPSRPRLTPPPIWMHSMPSTLPTPCRRHPSSIRPPSSPMMSERKTARPLRPRAAAQRLRAAAAAR